MKTIQFELCTLLICLAIASHAQQTVFNVPSADVLDRGKVYAEVDGTYMHSSGSSALTPRIVVGVGHRVEVGMNVNGFNVPGQQALTPAAAIKWEIFKSDKNGWSWLAGDDVFIPVQHRAYTAGNYIWTEAVHAWKSGTRVTFGAYHATPKVFGEKQKVGGQFAFEQPINSRLTLATDWYTGDSSVGYVTPGLIMKVTHQLTWYASYQVGNHDLREGNHQILMELGWNFN
jgi:hypothetical protein